MIELPADFSRIYADAHGVEALKVLKKGLDQPQPVSIRVNGSKAQPRDGADTVTVPWCHKGIYLEERPLFAADPLWHTGVYYVQEAGSMFLAQYLHGLRPKVAIDLCAAPGGKSTLLRDELGKDTLLICNEPETKRARILKENILRWGSDECIVTSTYPDTLKATGLKADLILVDAPCSGEGMFRKEPRALEEWSTENVQMCVSRQREILSSAWDMLEDGGILIYSTCTLNREENERQLEWLQEEHPDIEPVLLETSALQGSTPGVYRFSPGWTQSEGFTIFAVRKTCVGNARMRTSRPKTSLSKKPSFLLESLGNSFELYEHDGTWYALSSFGQEVLSKLQGIHVMMAGVPLGTTKGNNFLPHQGWVCSGLLSERLPYPRVLIDHREAMGILSRKPTTTIPQKGNFLLTYQDYPLCVIKSLGNRVNTYYPKEWAVFNNRITEMDVPKVYQLLTKV